MYPLSCTVVLSEILSFLYETVHHKVRVEGILLPSFATGHRERRVQVASE